MSNSLINKDELIIGQWNCLIDKGNNPQLLILHISDNHNKEELDSLYQDLIKNNDIDICFVTILVNDWNSQLSPWYAPAVFGKEDFKGEANSTLDFIGKQLLPTLRDKYSLDNTIPVILGGYSLAGLFSLWAAYNTDIINAVVACSPSVWYEGFIDYAKKKDIHTSYVYLSIGDKEEHTKNKRMATVGDCIRELDSLYKMGTHINASTLIYNKGNHFMDIQKRMTKGYLWAINQMKNLSKTSENFQTFFEKN